MNASKKEYYVEKARSSAGDFILFYTRGEGNPSIRIRKVGQTKDFVLSSHQELVDLQQAITSMLEIMPEREDEDERP